LNKSVGELKAMGIQLATFVDGIGVAVYS